MVSNTYSKFVSDDFDIIKEEFEKLGLEVISDDDFCTYQGWKEKGRKVKVGEKGLKLCSSNYFPQPVFHYGTPVYDEKTHKQKFSSYQKSYVLFHYDQTKQLRV